MNPACGLCTAVSAYDLETVQHKELWCATNIPFISPRFIVEGYSLRYLLSEVPHEERIHPVALPAFPSTAPTGQVSVQANSCTFGTHSCCRSLQTSFPGCRSRVDKQSLVDDPHVRQPSTLVCCTSLLHHNSCGSAVPAGGIKACSALLCQVVQMLLSCPAASSPSQA